MPGSRPDEVYSRDAAERLDQEGDTMGIGLGVVLVVVGAALMWAINLNIAHIDDFTLGLILFIVGIVAIVLSVYLNAQRNRTTHVERYEER
jgi:fucose permease